MTSEQSYCSLSAPSLVPPHADACMPERHAAYRIELRSDFELNAAALQVDYFSALGVSHIRCAPTPTLAPGRGTSGGVAGSTRGHQRLPELREHVRFAAALRRYGLEQLPHGTFCDDCESAARQTDGSLGLGSNGDIAHCGLLAVAAGLLSWEKSELSQIRESFCRRTQSRGKNTMPTPPESGMGTNQFHDLCTRIQFESPEVLHDLPVEHRDRGEDALARLLVLSETAGPWKAAITKWSARLDRYRKGDFPDRAIEYLFYETAVGTWPLEEARLTAFLIRAARESGVHTSWVNPAEDYERSLSVFVGQALRDEAFVADLREFVVSVTFAGRLNSLALTLIKLTAPGVPQIHQGTELWDLHLAGDESQHPVDYVRRRRLLLDVSSCDARACLMRMEEGMPKLWMLHRVLLLRKFRPEPFSAASRYRPIHASGAFSQYLVSYMRGNDIMVVVPRWSVRRGLDWCDTVIEVPSGEWVNCLTDEHVSGGVLNMTQLTTEFPLVLLERVDR